MSSVHRQRLINAVLYFSENTKNCGKTKLFKLLYLLDFEHFKSTGKSVTNLEYQAWEKGPVPITLSQQWQNLSEYLDSSVNVIKEQVITRIRDTVKPAPNAEFNSDHLTPRQLKLLKKLSEEYFSSTADEMIDVTHVKDGPWEKIWDSAKGNKQTIPYEMAVHDHPEREAILAVHDKQQQLRAANAQQQH